MKQNVNIQKVSAAIWIIFTLNSYFSHSTILYFPKVYQAINVLGIFLSIYVLIFAKFRLKSLVCYILFGTLLLYTSYRTDNYSLFIIYLMILVAHNLTITNCAKILQKCIIFFVGIHILLWIFVSAMNGIVYYTNGRISFLLSNPNFCSLFCVWYFIMDLWIHWDEVTYARLFCIIIISGLIYVTTRSDAVFIIIPAIVMYIFRKVGHIKKFCNVISGYIFAILGGFSLVGAYVYFNKGIIGRVLKALDGRIFNNRFAMSNFATHREGLTWLGKPVNFYAKWSETYKMYSFIGHYTIDNLYILLFVSFGIIYFLIISYGLFKVSRCKIYKVSVMIIMFSLYALCEVHNIYIYNCFVLVMLKYWIFKEKEII